MKKLLLLAVALALLTTSASAGLWSVATGPSKTVKTKAAYQVETPGFNPRIYEWQTAEGHTCVAMMASSSDASSPAIFCFKK